MSTLPIQDATAHVVRRGVHERLGGQPLPLREGEAAAAHGGRARRRTAPGEVTTATLGWFFAAARTIDGPPMSICSTHSSGVAPEATVSVNG